MSFSKRLSPLFKVSLMIFYFLFFLKKENFKICEKVKVSLKNENDILERKMNS